MKKAALRYAEILEKGAWVTHQEQDEIAKLLRKLVTTEAWDTSDMAHRTGGLSIDLDADEWYEKALWGKKLEPLAVLKVWDEKEQKHVFMNYHFTPPNKPWVGLTDDEIIVIRSDAIRNMCIDFQNTLCRAIEAKLKEKNNG